MNGRQFLKIVSASFLVVIILFLAQLAYAEIIWDEIEGSITLTSESPVCNNINNIETIAWTENSGETLSKEDCYREDAKGLTPYCCPRGYSCIQKTASTYECVFNVELKVLCNQYETKTACEGDSMGVAEEDMETKQKDTSFCNQIDEDVGGNCDVTTLCFCYWNTTGNRCDSDFDYEDTCRDINGKCLYQTNVENKCDSINVIETTWTVAWTGESSRPETCKEGSSTIPCISQALLSFFGWTAVIILLVLIFVYYKMKNKKTKPIKKQKKKKK
jgi:hypothetical protein